MITINQIKEDFNLESDDIEVILISLKNERIEIHPDRTKGVFTDKEHEERYHKVNESINYIENLKSNNSLAIIEQVISLVKVVKDLLPNTKETVMQTNLESRINFAIQNYKSKLFFPKISFTAISAIMTFLFAFPTQIKDNVILSKYLDTQSSLFTIIWLIMLIYTAMFWYIVYLSQERSKRNLSLLKVDSTQNDLFEKFIRIIKDKEFSKDQLTHFIYENYKYHKINSLLFFRDDTINLEVAQSIAEIVIARGEKKGVIKLSNQNSLSDLYILQSLTESSY